MRRLLAYIRKLWDASMREALHQARIEEARRCLPSRLDSRFRAGVLILLLLLAPGSALATTQTFTYTGTLQTFVVPAGVATATISVVGGEGGNNGTDLGGKGGSSTGTVSGLTAGMTLYIAVGAKPTSTTKGAWPGGGDSGGGVNARAGGGMSWVSVTSTFSASTVMIVGGAGGGACGCVGGNEGGTGGGLTGGNGVDAGGGNSHGLGGSQTVGGVSGGSEGVGAAGIVSGQSGGGGGLYGGGSGTTGNGSGGGGSGHVTSTNMTASSTANGTNLGDGFVTITYFATATPTSTRRIRGVGITR